jgi:hypothetical protein
MHEKKKKKKKNQKRKGLGYSEIPSANSPNEILKTDEDEEE